MDAKKKAIVFELNQKNKVPFAAKFGPVVINVHC